MKTKNASLAILMVGSFSLGGCDSAAGNGTHRPDAGTLFLGDSSSPFQGRDAGLREFGRAFGDPVSATTAPPAISGGTLLAAPTGTLVFASDPEDDRIVIVDTASASKLAEVALEPGDEPGRAVLDGAGRLHVALRRGGAIVTVDVSTPSAPVVTARRAVCGAPRGIVYDDASDSLTVACAGGELVTMPSVGAITHTSIIADDLRDVVIDGGSFLVSRFRSAEILVVDRASGTVSSTIGLPDALTDRMVPVSAEVAWRMIRRPDRGALVLHQRASTGEIDLDMPSAYGGGGCDSSVVMAAITPIAAGAPAPMTPALGCTPLAVDAAVSPDGAFILVAAAGAVPQSTQQFRVFNTSDVIADAFGGSTASDTTGFVTTLPGRITSVAYSSTGAILVQTRAPATIAAFRADGTSLVVPIRLGGAEHSDTGLEIFHSNVGAGLACASCHPEGGDDGHVWNFARVGARRTIPVRGGVSATAPYHWDGEFADMASLMSDVFARRMGGGSLDADYQASMLHWLDGQPQLPSRTVSDAAAVTRGHDLFDSPDVGCTDCHSGALASDELNANVGTGGTFQVPSLHGVVDRAPYLHDGRAATLADRFGPMGGGDLHGHTSQLSAAEIGDLVAYLRTL